MNKEQKQKLNRLVKMGNCNYVATYGLRWGALMFFFFIFWDKFIMERNIDNLDIMFDIILWGMAGLIVGLWSWSNINKKLKEK